jgi:hypothetical protein
MWLCAMHSARQMQTLYNMKYIALLVFGLISNLSFAQYTLDHKIINDPFFKTVASDNDHGCSIHHVYYEQQDGYGINGASMECYLLQEQVKDTLRARFNDQELFEMAQYSKIPFYRIAAFELYSQTNYSKEEVIQFLKRGKIPSFLSTHSANDTIPQTYIPMPNAMEPHRASIRFKLLSFIAPGAKRRTQKNDLDGHRMVYVPTYPESKPLDLESYISVLYYMRYYCEEHFYGSVWISPRILKPGEKPPKTPTFNIPDREVDFGTIDLSYLDTAKTSFELLGAIKVMNNTSKSITITGQSGEHTLCLKPKYVIPAKQAMMIEFKSIVQLNNPQIERTIILKNIETGGVQTFKFKAKFVHTKT